ncbi:MAG: cellulose binding domain-containing protein [Acidobacteriaceae bacterium]|nr:cellulose binding domain-containing protein [Acidobacteriaceae bacterium]
MRLVPKTQSVISHPAIALAACCMFFQASITVRAQSTCSPSATVSINGGQYIYQQNEWNSNAEQCATVSGVGFTLTTANFDLPTNGAPATYPSVYRGCHWGNCTSSNPFPIEESNIASASTSVSITQPSGYNNDAAYDIWFNQTSTTSGQPNGTEVMIWINHQGSPQPFGSQTATATIDGATWQVWTGRQSSWNIISYVRETPVTSVSNLNLVPFFSDAVSRGSLESSWWLIDVEYGFEIWTGGQGLAVSNFSVSAAAGSGGGGSTCSQAPSAPSGLTGTAASSSVINLSWTADVAPANCTITGYNVYRSTTSGFTPSSSNLIASGVTANSYSDSGLSAGTTYYYVVEAVDAAGTSPPSSQASATTSTSGGGGSGFACHVVYTISPQNSSAFGAAITIDNTGTVAISGWKLTWTFANGQTVSQLWNGAESQSGANVTVTNLSYNASIPAGGSYSSLGFNGTWNGTTNSVPSSFAVNGTTCK